MFTELAACAAECEWMTSLETSWLYTLKKKSQNYRNSIYYIYKLIIKYILIDSRERWWAQSLLSRWTKPGNLMANGQIMQVKAFIINKFYESDDVCHHVCMRSVVLF